MGRGKAVAVIAVAVVVVAGALGYSLFASPSVRHVEATSTVCSISGQPAALLVRILSDSAQEPVTGAQVSATNKPGLLW
jgi:hypothetical protein